jgi:hypothetical protein
MIRRHFVHRGLAGHSMFSLTARRTKLVFIASVGYAKGMNAFLAFLFYFVFTIVLAAGLAIAVAKGSPWLLLVGIAAYLGLFIKHGCLSH